MSEKNIKLSVEYKGDSFAGWQSQVNQRTVQDEIIDAIKKVTGFEVNLIGAGRTDAGVHALNQVANFRIEHDLLPERFTDALNFYLDNDIRIKNSELVDYDFHSRFDAKFRRYRYLVANEKSAIYRNLRYEYQKELNYEALKEMSGYIIGKHDFTPFCVVNSRKEDNSCIIENSKWYRIGPLLVYEIRGNRFLHSMVRSLVGAMINIATMDSDKNSLNLTLKDFKDILNVRTEERITFTAPAHGLYLVAVGY